jgi:hypothetical protein
MAVQPLMPPLASGSAGLQISTFVPEHTAERLESWCTPTRGEPVHERGRRLGEPVTTGTPTTSLPPRLLPAMVAAADAGGISQLAPSRAGVARCGRDRMAQPARLEPS